MIQQTTLTLPPFRRGYHLITRHITQHLPTLPEQGLLNLFIQHTSAALTINENADPDVRVDFETILNKIVPEDQPNYTHTIEGSDDMPAHVKSSLMGPSLTIPITQHQMHLGTWQGIYLCEFRNRASARRIVITVWS
jgi:secondary thiamine-phosphate synthase enzyme